MIANTPPSAKQILGNFCNPVIVEFPGKEIGLPVCSTSLEDCALRGLVKQLEAALKPTGISFDILSPDDFEEQIEVNPEYFTDRYNGAQYLIRFYEYDRDRDAIHFLTGLD